MDEYFKTKFDGIRPFEKKVWLSSPTMHGDEQKWVDRAILTNWVSTLGENIDESERMACELIGCRYAVALGCGTAALHLAVRLAGERLYGPSDPMRGALAGHKVFCSDMTFSATVNPVAYEGGEAVFIETEPDTWNMDPAALERAFALYPQVKLVVVAHLYGTPGKIDRISAVCREHGALLVEDAAESLGATYKGVQTGRFGTYNCISFNGNKVITGSSGGMFLTDSAEDAALVRKWSTQCRDAAPWYQHSQIGYNYRMSNIVAGVVRGQFPYLYEHIAQKRAVYERYRQGLKDLPVSMNPYDEVNSVPNFWLSCMIIDPAFMSEQVRGELDVRYSVQAGKTCPSEILEAIAHFNAEGRPIWKPMHLQPVYASHPFVKADDSAPDIGADIFARGLCLPSDNKMTAEQQDVIIEIIHRCFR